jgi:aspartate aminotransferase-like enzyme
VADPKERLITVNTIKVPQGADFAALSAFAMAHDALEISGGLGPTAGKVHAGAGGGQGGGSELGSATALSGLAGWRRRLLAACAPSPFYASGNPLDGSESLPQVWRIGLMGANATPANVQLVIAAFRDGLAAQGWEKPEPKA